MSLFNQSRERAHHTNRRTFSRSRFVVDVFGHVLASYAIFGAIHVINNVSHTPTKFSNAYALGLAAAFIASNFAVSKRYGNLRWFGLVCLALSSILGLIVFFLGLTLFKAFPQGIADPFDVARVAFFTILLASVPAIMIAQLTRFVSSPILAVVAPDNLEPLTLQ